MKLGTIVFCAATSTLFGSAAVAQQASYPSRPITWIIPVGPGSGADGMARLIGPKLGERLHQSVVVENRPGASQMIGMEYVAKSAPNGYTLVLMLNNITMLPSLIKSVPFNLAADFAPVSVIARSSMALGVNTSAMPTKDVRELVTMAKANPGKFNYATPGNGTTQHVGMELFKLREGLDIVHIPYKSISDANANLMGGYVQMMLGSAPAMKTLEASGKIRLLALSGPKRSPVSPETPTFGEMGYTYMNEVDAWWAMAAPAKTPAAIISLLNRELRNVLALPEVSAALAKQSLEVAPSAPEEMGALIKAEIDRWGTVIRTAKITAD